jgi:hypothetical protein
MGDDGYECCSGAHPPPSSDRIHESVAICNLPGAAGCRDNSCPELGGDRACVVFYPGRCRAHARVCRQGPFVFGTVWGVPGARHRRENTCVRAGLLHGSWKPGVERDGVLRIPCEAACRIPGGDLPC